MTNMCTGDKASVVSQSCRSQHALCYSFASMSSKATGCPLTLSAQCYKPVVTQEDKKEKKERREKRRKERVR